MSSRKKLTLWISGVMLLMLFITAALFIFIDNYIVSRSAEDIVVDLVWKNAEKLVYIDGVFDLREIDKYESGAYFSVFDIKNEFLAGAMPNDFDAQKLPFKSGVLSSARQNDTDYFVYDLEWRVASTTLLLRGVIPATAAHDALMNVFIVAGIWLLLTVFFGIFGANYIFKRTFLPIKALTEKAASISGGDNLSERIDLPHTSDEIDVLEKTFNDMFSRLEDSFESEKRFVSDASHELRTPTTIILAECSRARRKAKTPEDFKQAIGIIEEQCNKMANMISQLLSITRLDQGTAQVRMQRADFSAFLSACCDEFVPANDRGITFFTQIPPRIYLSFDPGLMSRVIQNLLENAYKYGRDNGTVLVALKRHDKSVSLYVIDDGIGISEEDQQYIFKRFWQADPSRCEDHGVGLGLSMVKQICDFHGYNLSVISKPGNGSSFIVTIPTE